jgi:predicted ester cyclase
MPPPSTALDSDHDILNLDPAVVIVKAGAVIVGKQPPVCGMSALRSVFAGLLTLQRPRCAEVAVSIGVLIDRFYGELWNRWDDSAVEETLSPGFTFRGSLGQETSERQGWRRYRDLVHAGSADFHNEIEELVCDGGRAAARLRFTGTHTGPLLGLPATQRRFEYAGAAFFTADERWLTSAWVLGDLDALRRQLR